MEAPEKENAQKVIISTETNIKNTLASLKPSNSPNNANSTNLENSNKSDQIDPSKVQIELPIKNNENQSQTIELQSKENSNNEKNQRKPNEPKKDFFGTDIDKEKKRHHITFRDITGKELVDIKEVESWKEYNVLNETVNAQCSCLVL